MQWLDLQARFTNTRTAAAQQAQQAQHKTVMRKQPACISLLV
jgi:hypothetical protein